MSATSSRMVRRLRALSIGLAILALFVYVSTSQTDSDLEDSLHSVGTVNTSVSRVLAERRAQMYTDAWIEYGSLVVMVLGGLTAVAGPRLLASVGTPFAETRARGERGRSRTSAGFADHATGGYAVRPVQQR